MIIKNINTNTSRKLYRKLKLNGPFLEVKTQKWFLTQQDDSDVESEPAPDNISAALNRCYDEA
jgi:DNA-binding transcriptional regulator YhcF (GntR family)